MGGDGATHQGVYDISYLRPLPNMSVAMPKDHAELQSMLKTALAIGGPKAIRWPRGGVERARYTPVDDWPEIAWGSWEVLKPGTDVHIFALGPTIAYALEAAGEDPRVGVVNARFIKPLDEQLLHKLAQTAKAFITVEDHTIVGGLGTAVIETLQQLGVHVPVTRLGIPDVHVPHGSPEAQHEELGYGPAGIAATLRTLLD